MNWIYNAKEITQLPQEIVGMVYQIYYTNGKSYIGSKMVRTTTMVPALKKGTVRRNSSRIKRIVRRDENNNIVSGKKAKGIKGKLESWDVLSIENNWKDYIGSSKLTSGLTITNKVILYLTTNKRSMTYLEDRELFTSKALESDKYINENIRGKYWDSCLDGLYVEPLN